MAKKKWFSLGNIFKYFVIGVILEAIFFSLFDPLASGRPFVDLLEIFPLCLIIPPYAFVFIPGAFVLGFIVLKLVDVVFRRQRFEVPKMPTFAAEKKAALKDYLQKATAREIDRGVMVSSLIKNGWSETEIDDALGEMSAIGES